MLGKDRESYSGDASEHLELHDSSLFGQEQNLKIEVLSSINLAADKKELIGSLLVLIKNFSGCEAVGIRLQDGEDYPYYQTSGFPDSFVALENNLCAYDQQGEIIRDSDGNPCLECMCGNIICGRFDSTLPFFTQKGTFWTNCTSRLLAETKEEDRQARTRNRCNGEGYQSVALVALKAFGKTIGLIQFNDMREDRFSPRRIELMESIAEAVAVAVSHHLAQEELAQAKKKLRVAYDREHHIADALQRALIPKVDTFAAGCRIAANYVPALNEAEVCGDFYDAFALPNGSLALVMGDISGKGLDAATQVAMMKHTIRAYACVDARPVYVLERLNHIVQASIPDDAFVTAFYGVFDPANRTLTYANAGHEATLYYSSEKGQVFQLDSTGKPLGIFCESDYFEMTQRMEQNDMLMLYTDGITEARNGRDFFGTDRLQAFFLAKTQLLPQNIVESLYKELMDFCGQKLSDDASVMVVKLV